MGLSRRARRWTYVALLGYAAVLALAFLSPTSVRQSAMAAWLAHGEVAQQLMEFVCNVLLVAPVTALGSLVRPAVSWRTWTAYAFVGAVAVEATQGLLLPQRTPSLVDVVANTLGGLLGAALGLLLLSRRRTVAGTQRTPPARPRPVRGRRS